MPSPRLFQVGPGKGDLMDPGCQRNGKHIGWSDIGAPETRTWTCSNRGRMGSEESSGCPCTALGILGGWQVSRWRPPGELSRGRSSPRSKAETVAEKLRKKLFLILSHFHISVRLSELRFLRWKFTTPPFPVAKGKQVQGFLFLSWLL